VFSPNRDGTNEFITIYSDQSETRVLELLIFDRWGELVFENVDFPVNDPEYGWDGEFRGETMNPGVFTFIATVMSVTNVIERISGTITLVR
jgi:gliding motility-associated-like protein